MGATMGTVGLEGSRGKAGSALGNETIQSGSRPSPGQLLPDLIGQHPRTRAVFDRYGLQGCGGRLGPHESIRFFARAHGVDESRLLDELEEAIASPPTTTAEPATSIADSIYRRYFLAAIALVLTAGATWGALLLWSIGLGGSYLAISIHSVNAHGEAQIFGWVGLFIMGFAYQAFPRIWHTRLVAPWLAAWAFSTMILGILLRTVGMTAADAWAIALPLAMAGGGLQIVAVTLFAGQIVSTFRRSGAKVEPYVGFILMALGWFLVSTLVSVWHTWNTMTAASAEALVWYVATYQAPLRDLQIHGLALFMILGVSLRMLPALFGLPRVADPRAWWAFGLLSVAVLAEVALFLAYRWTGQHGLSGLLMAPWVLLVVGVALVVLPWKPWRPLPEPNRSGKFVRAAFAWLGVSLAMLWLFPVYQAASGLPFSHAYYGAIRHAITVGFVSLMIMGMAAKVVPTLRGIDPNTLPGLWGPFLLVNVGCFLRVLTQTLTDWTPAAYAVVGVSGTLEVAGLAWWGWHLVGLMRRPDDEPGEPNSVEGSAPERIEGGHHVADVLAWFPETEPVFIRFGGLALRNPMMRRTIARRVSIEHAAALLGVHRDALLDALNHKIERRHLPPLNVIEPSGKCPDMERGAF